jgi:hypothetical protein
VSAPRRGEVWSVERPVPWTALVISSTVYNEIADEPTVLVMAVAHSGDGDGFCVSLGEGQWAVTGRVTFVAKAALGKQQRMVTTQVLTDVNNMLFKILATPDH